MNRREILRLVLGVGMAGGLTVLATQPAHATDQPYRIHWKEKDLNVNPLWEFYVDNVVFDLNAYAKAKYGQTATAYLISNHAYSWRIRYGTGAQVRVVGIDMLDVARWTGQNRWGGRVKNYGCYFVNWTGGAWRGTYIVRGFN